MRAKTFIVLVAVIISILTPVSINFPAAANETVLLSLDVCSAGDPYLSANSESAPILEAPVDLRVFEITSSLNISGPSLASLLFAVLKDHPPQI